ncbi:MAG: PIN domain-containing protein [Richelia sp. SM2_1_7]|nr:PIN domain-containing protein [Richelia sp. SM2_1_7]
MKHPYLNQPTGDEPKVKVMVDADVLIELFINRSGFVENSEKLLAEIEKSRQVEVYVTDKCLKRIQLEEGLGEDGALYVEKILCGRVIRITKSIRDEARTYCLPDFDSAEEVVCAKNEQLSAIITQNPNNFSGTNNLLILSVEELFVRLQLNENLLIQDTEEKRVIFNSTAIAGSAITTKRELNIEPTLIFFSGHCVVEQSSLPLPLLERFDDYFLSIFRFINLPKKKITNFYWDSPIKFDDFDNWINSYQALLIFQSSCKLLKNDYLCKNRIYSAIYSPKYLHKYLLKIILYKFSKKKIK